MVVLSTGSTYLFVRHKHEHTGRHFRPKIAGSTAEVHTFLRLHSCVPNQLAQVLASRMGFSDCDGLDRHCWQRHADVKAVPSTYHSNDYRPWIDTCELALHFISQQLFFARHAIFSPSNKRSFCSSSSRLTWCLATGVSILLCRPKSCSSASSSRWSA
jgi:hypothetical protein